MIQELAEANVILSDAVSLCKLPDKAQRIR